MNNSSYKILLVLITLLLLAVLMYIKSSTYSGVAVFNIPTTTPSIELPVNSTTTQVTNQSATSTEIITSPTNPSVITKPVTTKPTSTTTITTTTSIKNKPTFSGQLEQVNTGCFSDGECYLIVDGKHVTVLRGWSRDTVGTVIGEDGIGGLESNIGDTIDVYAASTGNDTYTLYGDANYYVKLQTSVSSNVGAGCMIGGCSSELCLAEGSEQGMSTCIYREQYACFKTATCAKQSSGQCGWTQTESLKMCIANAS